ncbi:neuferricin [Astyanax mexicanus]|uniref:Neuferricin n=2 Tax=Astyanax mexicanus TaxID=7994 RepID=A0A8T2MLY4_ASTMX|nr:neuferricin [Astyanax mexicanus]KAG9281741.1 neuferricin [Astyanax mexicanus]
MLRYLLALSAAGLALWWAPQGRWLLQFSPAVDPGRLLHQQELSQYSAAEPSKGLYLSLLGRVFDVGKGRKHYGPQGGYRFFTGRDASKAFVTGDFTEDGLTDDVSDLSPAQIVALYDWLTFYQKDYTPVGRLIGRFYTETGEPTDALRQVEASLAEGLRLKAQAEEENQQFPSCNSEWSSTSGGRVWCSTKSGGVHRDWTGVPRMLFSPGSGHTRCVCVQPDAQKQSNNPNLKEYKDCSTHAESCLLSQD